MLTDYFVGNNMQVGVNLDIRMTIRTSEQNALLLAVSANVENFVALDIFNGVVSLSVQSYPTRSVRQNGLNKSYL